MHPFDVATGLHGDAGADRRTARASDAYWTFISPFGGASAATALRAVVEHPACLGDPLAMTVNFCAPIERGEFVVRAQLKRANRSSQHWSVEFTQGQGDEPVLTASVVTAVRRHGWRHQPAAPPEMPAWDSLPVFQREGSLPWVSQYEFRFVEGLLVPSESMPVPPRSARSLLWIRDAPPRPLDVLSLAALSDAFFGRIFQVIGRLPPFGTVSMTTHFHASADELVAQGCAPLVGVADANVFHRSFGDQTVALYGTGGALLATSTQVAFYRVEA